MSLITRMRKQKAVYWALASSDSGGIAFDDFGQPKYTDPVEIKCRWKDVTEEFLDAKGARQLSHAKVYVDRDVDVNGILMLGVIADITNEENPKENDGAWEIKRFDKTPNFRATEFLLTAYL